MSTKYRMWITYNAEKEKIQLPVLPETFQTKNGNSNGSVNIAELGEIVVMQGRPALQISFSSFFPATKFPGLQVAKITKPLNLINKINTWKASRKPIHFIATGCGVNIYAVIDSFTYYETGGDPGTYQYSITLKEYREVAIRQVKVAIPSVYSASNTTGVSRVTATASVKNNETRVDNTVKPSTYTVQYGDDLWNIAKKYYNDGAKSKEIYEANKSIIGSRPNVIYPGQVLTLP